MLTHEVQYQIGRMPMHQGFTMDALLTKDAQEISLLFAPSQHPFRKPKVRPPLVAAEFARRRLWRIVNAMQCVTHEKIPGRHTHVLMRTSKPGETPCNGCHFASDTTSGCVLHSRGLMTYYIRLKYPIDSEANEETPIPVQLPTPGQRPIVWELPLRVSQPR